MASYSSASTTELSLDKLRDFQFERVLSESLTTGTLYLLGTIDSSPAILNVQRTVINSSAGPELIKSGLAQLDVFLENSPYFSAHAHLLPSSTPDLKITAIYPAGPEHVRKYSTQERVIITETAEMYRDVVVPFMESIPKERVQWVYNILAGQKEAERVLYKDDHPEDGFLLLPDLKWDQTSMNAMYLTAITQTRSLRSMRDLTIAHLPLLYNIKRKVAETVFEKYGVEGKSVRMFVHYQPTYYHFHVHVVHIAHEGLSGMYVGQAHLIDDLISLLELSPPHPEPSLLARMNLTYALGTQHPLCRPLLEYQKET